MVTFVVKEFQKLLKPVIKIKVNEVNSLVRGKLIELFSFRKFKCTVFVIRNVWFNLKPLS